jgi:ABC-type glycerol-3-phosphate transport system substrate-binding protein
MKNTNFQLIISIIFVFFIVLAVLIFSGAIKIGGDSTKDGVSGNVVIWGTLTSTDVSELLSDFTKGKTYTVSYVKKNQINFDTELIEALASGTGPDLILLPHDSIIRHEDKLYPIPFEVYSERTFRDDFITEGEVYLGSEGILGLPLSVDPLVMYYNLDILESKGIAQPPKYWEQIIEMTPQLTQKSESGVIQVSAIAFGTPNNIPNNKGIISALFLQLGNKITHRDNGELRTFPLLGSQAGNGSEKALQFFTDFADPTKEVYTWNRSRPDARTAFIGGESALYIGYASELFIIQSQNPNLRFDVTKIPQAKVTGNTEVTYGNMLGLSVLKSSKNLNTAYVASVELTGADFGEKLAGALSLPPARRDLLAKKPGISYLRTFYDSALIARGWLDPEKNKSSELVSSMIQSINSGRATPEQALSTFTNQLQLLIRPR